MTDRAPPCVSLKVARFIVGNIPVVALEQGMVP